MVCLDTVMIDFAMIVDGLPEPGGDAQSSRRLLTAGGGYNMMSAARRQGADVLYVGELGTGRFADIARGILFHEGIETSWAPGADVDLGVCVVLIDATGERTFITSPGAELIVTAADLATVELHSGDVVYISGYNVVYPEVADVVIEWTCGLPSDIVVAFDPGPRAADIAAQYMDRVLERTDWLLCNLAEAQLLSSGTDAVDLARRMRGEGDYARVVVRDGSRGCASASAEGLFRVSGFASDVVDTNGAGDIHNGVVIAELMRGTALDEALVRANAAASIAIASFGPATCPLRSVVDARLIVEPGDVRRF